MRFLVLASSMTIAATLIVACGQDLPFVSLDSDSGFGIDAGDSGAPKVDAGKGEDAGDAGDAGDSGPLETTYSIGGNVTGLSGTGLVLTLNGGDELPIAKSGAFSFPKKLAKGGAYAVAVKLQPTTPSQTCLVTAGTGTVGNGDVTAITVNCAVDTYAVGGTVSGLSGSGLVLENNAGDAVVVNADGTFAFPTAVASGGGYDVTVKTQPGNPSQTCVVTDGKGTITNDIVSNVAVLCTTNTYSVGGSVTGLSGTGLKLQINGGEELPIAVDGNFQFAGLIESGLPYEVIVSGQPSTPTQTCSIAGDKGTVGSAAVTSIVVNCASNTYTISGTVTGLAGTVVLQNNSGDDIAVTSNGTFAFPTPITSGGSYAVSVKTQPSTPAQTCTLSSASGPVVSANVTDVALTCVTNTYKVKAAVSGLAGTGLVLQNNGGDDLPVGSDGTVEFTTAVESGQTFDVTVAQQPTGLSQTCTVTSGVGKIDASEVTANITCVTDSFTVGGNVVGLSGSGLVLTNNGGDDLPIIGNAPFTFKTSILSGGAYAVAVKTQPTNPTQTCTVSADAGTVTNGNVATITVNCATNTYTVGGSVTGLVGTGLVLQNNAGDDRTVNGNGPFAFGNAIASNATYAVTVKTQPTNPSQTCTVTGAAGTVANANVSSVAVSCTTNKYAVGGTLVGLSAGKTVVLTNNGGNDLTLNGSGNFSFSIPLSSGAAFNVGVKTQPAGLFCHVVNGSGTVGGTAIQNVVVSCGVSTPVSTVCGKSNPTGIFCGGNCSANHAEYADNYCKLAGFAKAFSYDVLTNGSVSCLYYNGGESTPLTQCSQVNGPSGYGLASYCDAVTNLQCQ